MKMPNTQEGFSHILVIVIGILVLLILTSLWFFKDKFNIQSPQTHSSITWDQKTFQKVVGGSTITGKGIPTGFTETHLVPGNNSSLIPIDNEGNWSFQLPKDLKSGKYRLTVNILDKNHKLVEVRSFKIELENKSFFGSLKINEAKAQNLDQLDITWVSQMQAMGLYPALEDGEVILYSREEFVATYCQQNNCYLNHPSTAELMQNVQGDIDFISRLVIKLSNKGYSPYEALVAYFPDIYDYYRTNSGGNEPPFSNGEKTISEDQLVQAINEVANDKGWAIANKEEYFGDPVKTLVTVTDPIFSTRALIAVLTLPPHKVSDNQRLEALIGLSSFFIPPLKTGGKAVQATSNTFVDMGKMIEGISQYRKAIKEGASIPLSSITRHEEEYITVKASFFNRGAGGNTSKFLSYLARARGHVLPRDPAAVEFFNTYIRRALADGQGFQLPKEELTRVAQQYADAFNILEQSYGIQIPNKQGILNNIQNGNIYVVEGRYLPRGFENDGGTVKDLTFVSRAVFDNEQRSEFTIFHEIFHQATEEFAPKGWVYGGDDQVSHIFSGITEFTTDWWADIATGKELFRPGTPSGTFGYISDPYYGQVVETVYNRILAEDQSLIPYFLEFSITKDPQILIEKFFENPRIAQHFDDLLGQPVTPQTANLDNFRRIFQSVFGINLAAVSYYSYSSDTSPKVKFESGYLEAEIYKLSSEVQVTITSVQGDLLPNNNLYLSAIGSVNGSSLNDSEYKYTWELQSANQSFRLIKSAVAKVVGTNKTSLNEVTPLEGGAVCGTECDIRLPSNLSSNNYKLNVYLSKKDSDEILAIDSYSLNAQGIASQKLTCSENEQVFAGCDESACGKEFWKCSNSDERVSLENPTGDCALKGGPNPACMNEGRSGNSGGRFDSYDSEGNKVPFFGILLGPDPEDNLGDLQAEAQRRISEMKDYSGSLDYLKGQTSDPEVMRLIDQAQGKVNACYQ